MTNPQPVDVGFAPYRCLVHLMKADADFNATIRTSDLSAFPDSAVVTLKLATETPTLWVASISDYTDKESITHPRAQAAWSIDKADVAALVPGTMLDAHVLYADDSGADLVWFTGQVKWHD